LKRVFKHQFKGSAFRLVVIRSLVFCFLILSVMLPQEKITYYSERKYEDFWWYTSLFYGLESHAGSQDQTVRWNVEWYAMPYFAFPFILMYFGLKKRYTFDLGVIAFALFLGLTALPPLISPMSAGAGWDLVESEALVGFYIAAVAMIVYGVARLYLRRASDGLEADRIPPPETVEQSEVVKRRFILALALLSFVLPFAVEYKIYHYQFTEFETIDFSTVYHWFGDLTSVPLPFSVLFLPVVYLPLIMMWLGVKRTGLFNNGVRLFMIYWVWHLLFFLQPLYVAVSWRQQITAPTVGIVFFPTILLLYVLAFLFKSERINRFLLESGLRGKKVTPKAFLKKCPKCDREIPIASEECPYCGIKQPEYEES
jgi:hypothetical protein